MTATSDSPKALESAGLHGAESNEMAEPATTTAQQGAIRAVIAAMLGNVLIAAAKFVAAAVTGSSAMLSEGIHSVVDTGNQALLLVGDRRSRKAPDERHPFGYGRELYFWSLVVAIVLFGVGGGLSMYEGFAAVRRGGEARDPLWSYVVLGVAFVSESASLSVAWREFRRLQGTRTIWQAFTDSKDPRIFVPLAEDCAALLGIAVAFAGIWLSRRLAVPALDGVSSMVIGLILGAVALLLAGETRGLLVGERADQRILRRVRDAAGDDPDVLEISHALTVHMGPDEIVLNLGVYFRPDQSIQQVAAAAERLKARIRAVDGRISRVFVEIAPWPALRAAAAAASSR